LDLDRLHQGFKMDLGIGVVPFYFMYNNRRNGWGFGFSFDAEAYGSVDLSGKMLSLSEAKNEISDISGVAFASAGMDTYFNIRRFKVKLRPAFYYTLAYIQPDISYTFFNYSDGTVMNINYDLRIFTAMSENSNLTAVPGFDFSFGLEYPLSRATGIDKLFPILDFDVGFDMINVPVVPSKMNDYIRLRGQIGKNDPFYVLDDEGNGLGDFFSSLDGLENNRTHGKASILMERPFKTFFWINWRPLFGRLVTITPVMGFSVNQYGAEQFVVNGGINASVNLLNFLIVKAGKNHIDNLWVNSLDFGINFKSYQIDIGISSRGREYLDSWNNKSFGLNVGFKFGI